MSTVSYSGQTARHLLMLDMVTAINSLTADPTKDVNADIGFYFDNVAPKDDVVSLFSLGDTSLLHEDDMGDFTYGDISTGKNLIGKIAGNDKAEHILGDGMFGWEAGFEASDLTPQAYVEYLIGLLHEQVTDNIDPQIAVDGATVPLDVVTVTPNGIDLRQLIQKFLTGAVAFSQGTTDYLQTDFANSLAADGDSAYSVAEHKWDEAFGYFGAARDFNDYTDLEARAAEGRPEYANGYHDINGDGEIDLRAEYNFGHSTNCAKRDVGTADSANPTDYTKEAFDAFLAGRQIIANATAAGTLTADAEEALQTQISMAAVTWEKCIAATAIHYINDTLGDLDGFVNDAFADLDAFKNLAKHWSEMKGFALSLQFSPESPFRADAQSLANLETILSLMGDEPVMPDGDVAQYRADLLQARDLLQAAYGFDADHVENW